MAGVLLPSEPGPCKQTSFTSENTVRLYVPRAASGQTASPIHLSTYTGDQKDIDISLHPWITSRCFRARFERGSGEGIEARPATGTDSKLSSDSRCIFTSILGVGNVFRGGAGHRDREQQQ